MPRSPRALDINDEGEACGFVDVLISAEPNRLPCYWKPEAGAYSELTVLPVPESAFSASALALNDRGVIVGYYEKEGGAAIACAWEPGDAGHVFVDLETAGVARGINAIDQIVGGTDRKGYLWQCGKRYDLATVPGYAESGSRRVLGITDLGDLVTRGNDGQRSLLTPVTKLKFSP